MAMQKIKLSFKVINGSDSTVPRVISRIHISYPDLDIPDIYIISEIDQKNFLQLKPDSDIVLSPDFEYMSQSGQIGR